MVGPGPQQPSSEHSGSQIRPCRSVEKKITVLMFCSSFSSASEGSGRSGLTAGAVDRFVGLVFASEEAGPLHGLGVAQVGVLLQQDVPGAHLLQGAQAEPLQVLHLHHHQTVLTERKTGGVV